MSYETNELSKRGENIIKFGVIKSVMGSKAIVDCGGGLETPPIPWPTLISRTTAIAWAPIAGQPCAIASPGGDISIARIIAIYARDGEAEGDDFTVQIKENSEFATGVVTITGETRSTGDQVAGGVSQISHVHGGVVPGKSKTKEPS